MLNTNQIIEENRKRLAEIRKPYNPVTGEGSISIPRVEVRIKDCPIEILYLPETFAETGFVKKLIEVGFNGYIKIVLKTGITEDLRDSLWTEFNKERIKHDFEFWAFMLAVIAAKGEGRDVPFTLNRAQRYYLKELEELRLAQAPIDIILCKARQWGGSTLTQLYMLWIQLCHKRNWNSVICGDVQTQASVVAGMLSKVLRNYKDWATDGVKLKSRPFEGSQSTRIIDYSQCIFSLGSAQKPESLRSQDVSMAHLSEVGIWKETKGKKPEDLVQAIFGSILSAPYTMKVLESTAKGVGNYFHRTWLDAVQHKNNFKAVFVPWFMIDIYSKKLDTKKYCDFIATMNEYEHWLFRLGATLEAINWYRGKQKEIKDTWRMCSEYPSTANEAFQSTGKRIFPMQYVENTRRTCIDPCFYGEFVGKADKGKDAFENLHFEHLSSHEKKEDNCLWVWVMPDLSMNYRDRYIVSVDVGGVSDSSDPSVIKVADRLPMLEVEGLPEVVAEWHGHIEHDLLIWKAAQIARAYGNALLVIESNTLETDGTEGDNSEYILEEIRGFYDNLYSRTSPEQIKKGMPTKYGFHTNTKTKPAVIGFLKSAMRDCLYIERSRRTTFEFDLYELKENGTEMGAVEGNHDDLVMATAIMIYVCYKWALPTLIKVMTEKEKRRTRIVSEASM